MQPAPHDTPLPMRTVEFFADWPRPLAVPADPPSSPGGRARVLVAPPAGSPRGEGTARHGTVRLRRDYHHQ